LAYIEKHAKPHKRSWEKDKWRLDTHMIPVWGKRKVTSISRIDVLNFIIISERTEAFMRQIELSRSQANCLSVPSSGPSFRLARKSGEENSEIQRNKTRQMGEPEELPKLAEAIDKEQMFTSKPQFGFTF